MNQKYLNLASHLYPVTTLGPGNRYAIWVQGCPFSCKGCCTPDYIPFTKASMIQVEELAHEILKKDSIDGVTLSGGEPFAQAEALSLLILHIKSQRPDMNFISFTGFSFEKLKSKEQIKLLGLLDLVITELFVEDLNTEFGLSGSENQKFIFLTSRLDAFREEIEKGKKKIQSFILNDQIVQVGIMSESERKYQETLFSALQDIGLMTKI